VSQFLVCCCFINSHFSIFCRSNVSNSYSLQSFDTWDSFRLSLDIFIYFQLLRMFCFRMAQPRHFYLKNPIAGIFCPTLIVTSSNILTLNIHFYDYLRLPWKRGKLILAVITSSTSFSEKLNI